MSKLFRHISLKKENTTQKRENNLNDICDIAKVRDLRDFYKTVAKKNNEKSDDKVPPFYPLHTLNLERIITPQFENALRMRLANTF